VSVLAFVQGFVNPALVGGLVLLAAPIIIHFLNKRHYQVVNWAAMDFLLQADSRNRRRVRLEDLILLLLRMLILALLVFTVARPLLRGAGATREEERIVVLDDSFSMEASDGAATAFSLAKAAAVSQIEDAVGRSISASVWLGTRPEEGGRDLVIEPGAADAAASDPSSAGDSAAKAADEAAALLAWTRAASATDASLRLTGTIERLAERFAARPDAGLRSVVLVSDFRAADWLEPLPGGGRAAALRSDVAQALAAARAKDLFAGVSWRFVDVGSENRDNVAVTAVRSSTPHPLARVPVRILVDVRNFGAADRRLVTGELEVWDGTQVSGAGTGAGRGTPRVLHRIPLPAIEAIPAGKSATAEVEFTFETAGVYPVVARIEGDRLARDDASFAVLEVREGIRVLVLDGDPGEGRFSGESGFLLSALAPRGSPSGILPRRVAGELRAADVAASDAVFVLNRKSLSAAEREALEDLLARGGGVLFFLGNQVDRDAYRELAAERAPRGSTPPPSADRDSPAVLFPALPGDVREAPAGARARLRLEEGAHPAFDLFRGIEGSSLEQVGFDRFLAVDPLSGARVVARFTDPGSTPAIIEKAAGRGTTAVFNTTADRDWGDWPADPSYPVVLQEWARHLAAKGGDDRRLRVGEPIRWEPAPGIRYAVILPGGEERPVDTAAGGPGAAAGETPRGTASWLTFGDTRAAGFYAVAATQSAPAAGGAAAEEAPAGKSLAPRWYACVRDPEESDLEPAGEARLRDALAGSGVEFSLGREVDVDVFEKSQEGESWRWLALGAWVFLLAELFAAWWFGRQ
jgi:hypothetical protein